MLAPSDPTAQIPRASGSTNHPRRAMDRKSVPRHTARHDRPRDYQEYFEDAERPPIHLLRTFLGDEMMAEEIDQDPISNQQASLFDSQ